MRVLNDQLNMFPREFVVHKISNFALKILRVGVFCLFLIHLHPSIYWWLVRADLHGALSKIPRKSEYLEGVLSASTTAQYHTHVIVRTQTRILQSSRPVIRIWLSLRGYFCDLAFLTYYAVCSDLRICSLRLARMCGSIRRICSSQTRSNVFTESTLVSKGIRSQQEKNAFVTILFSQLFSWLMLLFDLK